MLGSLSGTSLHHSADFRERDADDDLISSWEGELETVEEVGICSQTGRVLVRVDARYFVSSTFSFQVRLCDVLMGEGCSVLLRSSCCTVRLLKLNASWDGRGLSLLMSEFLQLSFFALIWGGFTDLFDFFTALKAYQGDGLC